MRKFNMNLENTEVINRERYQSIDQVISGQPTGRKGCCSPSLRIIFRIIFTSLVAKPTSQRNLHQSQPILWITFGHAHARAQSTVWSDGVVVSPPLFDDDLSLLYAI